MDTPKRSYGGRFNKFAPDLVELFDLAAVGMTNQEIANFYDCSLETIQTRKDVYTIVQKGRAKFIYSLRKAQLDNVMKGNVVMQIWLGKQHLGQHEPIVETKTEIIAEVNTYATAKLSNQQLLALLS